MLGKLSFRNMKRSARDYLVYILTMTVVAALMYAFNSLIFQSDLDIFSGAGELMPVMIGLATVFIVLIVAWLINYMVRFMLEKRSSEFGIYLLLGMRKKTISRLYIRENLLLGSAAFGLGMIMGILLRQVLMAVMFSMVQMEYRLQISFHVGTILMTVLCYAGCYLLALLRCRRKFRKMNIHALMNAKRQNDEIREKHEGAKRVLLPISVLFILVFWTVFRALSNAAQIALFLVGLVLTIYLFYVGLSAWIICYVRKKGSGIYKGQNLFLLRQFASKVRTMQFTMGTLSALFTLALMGASIALMFSDYENTVLKDKFPFDIQIYSSEVDYDFAEEIDIIYRNTNPLEFFQYHIYTDQQDQVNAWMLTHLREWGTMYLDEDGNPDMQKIRDMLENRSVYCTYDTYMGLSDYNHLRGMLGYESVALNRDQYAVHIKSRLREDAESIGDDLRIAGSSEDVLLSCAGIYSEGFSQDGHNGGDYVIVVPDEVLVRMVPYYSELVVDIEGEAPMGLEVSSNKLKDLTALSAEETERDLATLHQDTLEEEMEEYTEYQFAENRCVGSDNIILVAYDVLVRDNLIPEVKYVLAALIIPLFYIGLVFVCVAVTVLSVQQLSDSAKYKFRYDVLSKLGLERSQIHLLIGKQLAAYYLCPAILAIVISGKMILTVSWLFVFNTGVPTAVGGFFARSILLFFGIYLVYFAVTYIGFVRNVEE